MPYYLKLLESITGLKPQIDNNPDEIVSKGAALFAENNKPDSSKLIIDVTPLSLGTSVSDNGIDGIFDILIPANSSIPIEKKQCYSRVYEDQDSVLVDVYQGERRFSKDNIFLGDVILGGLKQKKTYEQPDLEVTFRITSDGNLDVSAIDLKTKSTVNLQIKNSLKIPMEKVARIRKYANQMVGEDKLRLEKLKKIINLSLLKKVFDQIDKPVLSTSDEITIEEMNLILTNKDATHEELDDISRMMRIIVREQDAFKVKENDLSLREVNAIDIN